jgi:SAM-dependent methyltransferase
MPTLPPPVHQSPQMETNEIQEYWTQATAHYVASVPTGIDISRAADWYWRYLDRWERETSLKYSSVPVVLDLGCGTGRLTRYLAGEKGKNLVSVDYIWDALNVLQEALPVVRCANMDVTKLGLGTGKFDTVVSCRVLQSLLTPDEKERALGEINRILKPGGTLVLIEGNPLRQKFVKVPYNYYLPLSTWKPMLDRQGFTIEKVTAIPFLTFGKLLDKVTFGILSKFQLPFHLLYLLDRTIGQLLPHMVSLQIDIIARKK